MSMMVYPYMDDTNTKQNKMEGNGDEEPQGAAVRGGAFGAFLATIWWVPVAIALFYVWLLKAVS